ncbi:hypothetical protein [Horticoccus sp. 23ND18S-11]|uniref:hypothetical protein n=1 Tax=Horticoccus sp. 23ND18S-11 TaxID=3391832 RepID=UPI0039C95A4C
MAALALSFAFLLFTAGLGRAVLALCGWRGGVLRAWLLAPATGLAVVVLAVMVLNQAGLPVRAFAWPLTLGLAVAAAGIFVWRRPIFPLKALAPFVAVAVFSLLWTGWPLLRFGFGWLSYVNDDYVNYCFAAERFMDYGFWRVPTLEELGGTDVSQYYWFMHVPGLMRFGSELTLAWVAALTGIKSLGIFMPVIIGLGMIQLASTAALVLHHGRWRRRALITCALLAISPLFMLGTLYQLIAQVGGLALLLAVTAILTGRLPSARKRIVPHVLVLAIVGSAIAVFYPEVTAFAVLTAVIAATIDGVRRRAVPTLRITLVVYGLLGVILLLRHNTLSYVFTIMLQMGSGFKSVDLSLSLFPYFMIPTGLANLFGLMPLSVNFAEPIASITILGGLAAIVIALVFALRESWRAAPIGVLLLVQFVLAIKLMRSGNDFGLYKIAMFMQPALAGALAVALLRLPWSRVTAPLGVLVALACCAPTALFYTRVSQGEKAGGITEAKLASILGTQLPATPPRARLLADINNLVAAKVAALEARGTDLRFLSRDYYQQIAPIEYEILGDTLIGFHPRFADLLRTRAMLAKRDEATIRVHTVFENTPSVTSFRAPALDFNRQDSTDVYLTLDPSLGLFNKFEVAPGVKPASFFKAIPAADAHNHLVFMHTGRGNHYYLGDRNRIAIYQPEADPYTTRQDITGLGQFLLLRVEKPDEEFYLRISATKTFMGGGHTSWSPGSKILGAKPVPLAFPGNGAVNRIVGPIRPIFRDGAAYIAIDFNELPVQFPIKRTGLQSLYHPQVPLDSRKLVAYGRDISALSAAQAAALERPSKLTRFPDDLLFARGLEFSGIYEDGWLSPESDFILGGGGPDAWVRVRGFVPEMAKGNFGAGTLQITLASGTVEVPAAVGSFDWLLPVGSSDRAARIGLRFTTSAPLPSGDDRPVGGKLEWMEVFPSLPTHLFEFGKTTSARLASTGIDQDGWFAKSATIQLPPFPSAHDIILTFEYPGWSDTKETTVTAHWPGQSAPVALKLVPGSPATMRVRLPASAKPRTLRFEAANDFPLAAPDTRRRSGRLVQLELQPALQP